MFSKEFILSNFPKGKLTIVASRPAMGKTSFGISLAASLAQDEKHVAYFSLEYAEIRAALRMSQQIGEDNAKAINGRVYIDDTPKAKVSYIRSQLEHFCFDFVIIDYLQLMNPEHDKESRDNELEEILTDLNELAAEQNLPVVVLSQLTRYICGIGTQKPYMSSLQPYFNKTMDEMNVAFLYRPDYYHFYEKDALGNKLEGKMNYIRYVNDNDISTPLNFNKETTEVSMMTTWDSLKMDIINSPRWIVNIDMYDLKAFEGDNADNIIVIDFETSDMSENRFMYLTNSVIGQIKGMGGIMPMATKAMVYIQFPLSSPLMMEELSAIHNLVEEIIPSESDCEIMWGMSPREDDVSRIVCAINPNNA